MFFKLITLLQDNDHEFDVRQYERSISDLGVESKLDIFLVHWVFFNYKYPITESDRFSSVFSKQNDLSSKLGVLSRHLIKTAKDVGVDQYLIDHYCKCKKESSFYSEYNKDFDKRIYEEDLFGEDVPIDEFIWAIERRAKIKGVNNVWKHQFNSVTFKLIKETLKK